MTKVNVKNKHFAYRVSEDCKDAIDVCVLTNELNEIDFVVLIKNERCFDAPNYYVYRIKYFDGQPEADFTSLGSSEYNLGVFDKFQYEEAREAFFKATKGLVKCSVCGKWVPIEESLRFVPAMVTCKDEKCKAKGEAQEKDFFSYPLD